MPKSLCTRHKYVKQHTRINRLHLLLLLLLLSLLLLLLVVVVVVVVVVFSLFGPVWQEPEPSQATGMALVRCVLGRFLGVGCHCSTLHLDVLTFAAKCPHVPINTKVAKGGNIGREMACDPTSM
jgi:hypothetical protein